MRQSSKDGDEKGTQRGGRKYSTSTLSSASSTSSASMSASAAPSKTTAELITVAAAQGTLLTPVTGARSQQLQSRSQQQFPVSTKSAISLPSTSVEVPVSTSKTGWMLVRQKAVQEDPTSDPVPSTSALGAAQSVKEVWINSCKKPVTVAVPRTMPAGNMAHLENIASNLEQTGFHPSNPEGSMIKELLIKLKNPEQQQMKKARDSSSSSQATVIEIKSSSVSPSTDPSKPTHVIYADPTNSSASSASPVPIPRGRLLPAVTTTQVDVVNCNLCSSSLRASDLSMHQKYDCPGMERDSRGVSQPKKPKFDTATSSGSLTGGTVKPIEKEVGLAQQGLLQIAQPALQSGGGVVSQGAKVTSATASSMGSLGTIISTTAFSIPDIPTPSLSGVLTGIKSAPLFSLPGKRMEMTAPLSSGKPKTDDTDKAKVPYVLGMPGPYSQSSTPKQPDTITTAKMTSGASSIPTITVSPASSSSATGEIKIEVESEKEDSKFLRPSSLSLAPGSFKQKKHVMLASGGATLVSPETPRPRKSYVLTYQVYIFATDFALHPLILLYFSTTLCRMAPPTPTLG